MKDFKTGGIMNMKDFDDLGSDIPVVLSGSQEVVSCENDILNILGKDKYEKYLEIEKNYNKGTEEYHEELAKIGIILYH